MTTKMTLDEILTQYKGEYFRREEAKTAILEVMKQCVPEGEYPPININKRGTWNECRQVMFENIERLR